MNLKGKTIVLGITGGIAAYKMPNVAHALAKAGANVKCADDQKRHGVYHPAGV